MLVAIATRPDSLNRAREPVTVQAYPARDGCLRCLYRLPRSPKPSSAPEEVITLDATRCSVPMLPVMTTLIARATRPQLVILAAEHPGRQAPHWSAAEYGVT